MLDQILLIRGAPERLRVDHGPEFTSAAFVAWFVQRSIELEYTQPGKPTQNAFAERFNGIYHDGVLELREYNTIRPHESLGEVSPIEFLTYRGHTEISSYARSQVGKVGAIPR